MQDARKIWRGGPCAHGTDTTLRRKRRRGARADGTSVDASPVTAKRPIHEHAAAHDILLWHGSPIAAVGAVIAVVTEREIMVCRYLARFFRIIKIRHRL